MQRRIFKCQDCRKKQKPSGHFLLTPLPGSDSLISCVSIVLASASKAIVPKSSPAPTIKSMFKCVPQTSYNPKTMAIRVNTLPVILRPLTGANMGQTRTHAGVFSLCVCRSRLSSFVPARGGEVCRCHRRSIIDPNRRRKLTH